MNLIGYATLAILLVAMKVDSALLKRSLMETVFAEVREQVELMETEEAQAFEKADYSSGHLRMINNDGTKAIERWNRFVQLATQQLVQLTGLGEEEVENQVINFSRDSEKQLIANDVCVGNDTVIACNSTEIASIFPPIGGRCNNVNFPLLGTINRPYRRLLNPCARDIINTRNTLLSLGREDINEDSTQEIQKIQLKTNRQLCRNGNDIEEEMLKSQDRESSEKSKIVCSFNQLPNVRLVSRTFHTDQNVPSTKVNQFFTMFSQFVDHDFTFTATQSVSNCCLPTTINDFTKCLPIIVPNGDPFFPNGKCLTFSRSLIFCKQNGCNYNNINQLTAFIDAGNVYGSDPATAQLIRGNNGLLLTSASNLLPRLPTSTSPFKAGETRARENPALATVHTIFLREHNRVAKLIATAKPTLTSNQIYDNARRIVTAEMQNIVFDEFLSLLIGPSDVFSSSTTSTRYNSKVDPSIFNEFAASAFRFGHTLINGLFQLINPSSGALLSSYLHRFSNNNETLYSPNNSSDTDMQGIAKGMTLQAAQSFDNFITQELTNFLYAAPADNFLFGSDLAARNIQRGRDNRISGWVNYRRWCGKSVPRNWNDKPSDITQAKWNTLKTLYISVNDIDLFTGSLAEDSTKGGVLGSTSRCIVEEQFERLVKGDRYFFTHANNVGSKFISTQIAAIKKVKIFDILCLNTNINQLQKRAFENVGPSNPLVSCSQASSINVNLFL